MEHERPVVLVVDDDTSNRISTCEHLRENGFHSLGVNSAERAIVLLDNGFATDLVFCDARMPGDKDGYGLARWVGEHHPELPIILTAGKDEAALPCSAEILPKPYALDSALAKIRQVIAGHKVPG
jgi:DNA-binding NtrC family response regulator